ncbi:NAD(P)-binding protein [Mollisia scopiformis]|uniref:NAD(P)-binding protein n=1 Tax=Mollisia scopiformis TaxID=149040 RepID=A0A194XJV2_MOLSC|nr:NAD(P)-binding protein [Mollisia scopiformis]KUJ20389.1 NAD(P)-binding protein [Mollisia scopiformis]
MSMPTYTKTFHTTTYPAISPLLPSLSTARKVVLLTGGGSSIATSIALSFAASGSKAIVLLGRNTTSLLSNKTQIETKHPSTTVLTFVADINDEAAVNAAFTTVQQQFGGIDILLQIAAYFPDGQPIATASVSEYFSGFETNVKGNLIVTQAFLRTRTEKREAVLIHVSTGGVHLPAMPFPISAYIASKAAAAKMMEYLSVELKEKGVRVLNVHPGMLDTVQGIKAASAGMVVPFDDAQLSADFMVWLASPEAEFLHGKLVWANWDVDELKAKKEELLSGPALTLGLNGWP